MKTKTKTLYIFDFDSTLFDSPTKENGLPLLIEKYGSVDFKGWWGRLESMDSNVFDIEPVPDTIDIYNKVTVDDTKVLLTGRIPKFENIVKGLCEKHELTMDEYHFNTGSCTLSFKTAKIKDLVERYDPEHLVLIDDRESHYESFETLISELCVERSITGCLIRIETAKNR